MRGSHNRRTVPFRRKREQRTDYRQRLTLLKSQKPRLVVRKSLKHMQAQLVLFEPAGDKVLASAHSRELKNSGYNCATSNMSAAYLTGVLLAKKAKDKTIKHAVVDLGLYARSLKSNLFAVVKGARDGGLDVPADESALPSDERVAGAHVAAYAALLKKQDPKRYEKQFSWYLKNKVDPESIVAQVKATKQRLVA
ncbi:MAG TPA: 50S ribosomal protein L18 [Candidatus Nanoarchaeia archaeon]|nr:50S ribosomal protein L18 [Candidatus Nanoarchaeia archaeon]